MLIIGSDFTSDPKPGKPITAAICRISGRKLVVNEIRRLVNFQSFALLLDTEGSWTAGIDFPFGQPERLIDDLNWARKWADYVRHVARMGKREFRRTIDTYREGQPRGQKEH